MDAPREDVDAPDAPCTKTEGCILASGHDGECITADEEAPEESIPYSGLRFCFLTQEGQGKAFPWMWGRISNVSFNTRAWISQT